jgi:hypothetical protein
MGDPGFNPQHQKKVIFKLENHTHINLLKIPREVDSVIRLDEISETQNMVCCLTLHETLALE